MSTAIHTTNGHAPTRIPARRQAPSSGARALLQRLELPRAFAEVVLRYLLLVLPQAGSEEARWRARAAEIPSPTLRHHALQSMGKRGNIEGAAMFAALAPRAYRRDTVRALVAYQTAYNYLDALSELPSEDPVLNADQLHQALLIALHSTAEHPDYYAFNPDRDDDGYLHALIDACRDALARLPSHRTVAATARWAASRIVDFQALNLSESQGGHEALRRWALDTASAGDRLTWWESAAAAGSSLSVHALIAAAAEPNIEPWDARDIDRAYHPSIGALHSLLDSLVDRREDEENGRRCLLDYYDSTAIAVAHLGGLADRAVAATERLPHAHVHRVILTAMCSYYCSAPACATDESRAVTRSLTGTLGCSLSAAILMFRSRRMLHTLTRREYA